MDFDIFFSISQTPDTSGRTPSEREMLSSFFDQVEHADELGFGVGCCLLYTSPSPRDGLLSRMPSSA